MDPPLNELTFWLYKVETGEEINYYGPVKAGVDASQLNEFMFLPFLSQ